MLFKTLKQKYKLKKDPIGYWRERGMTIGKNCEIYSSANFGSEPYMIKLGDHVRVNSGVTFVTHDGGVWVIRYLDEVLKDADIFGKISVGSNVHIGTNAIIMPNVTIGDNCIIGCGAVVTRDIPSGSIAVGVPARVIKTVEEYKAKHIEDFVKTKSLSQEEKRKFITEKYLK